MDVVQDQDRAPAQDLVEVHDQPDTPAQGDGDGKDKAGTQDQVLRDQDLLGVQEQVGTPAQLGGDDHDQDQDQVEAQDKVLGDGQDLLNVQDQADTQVQVDGEVHDQVGAEDQVLRDLRGVQTQDQAGAQDQALCDGQDLLDAQDQADAPAQVDGQNQDQADEVAQAQPEGPGQDTGGDQAEHQDQVSLELHTEAVQDQAPVLSHKRKRDRTFNLRHPSPVPMNRARITKLITLLRTRIGVNDSECGKKFWKILANKSAEKQSIHKEVDVMKQNQEHSIKNQETKSGTHQECQEIEVNNGTKHMLGQRQLKLRDSNTADGGFQKKHQGIL